MKRTTAALNLEELFWTAFAIQRKHHKHRRSALVAPCENACKMEPQLPWVRALRDFMGFCHYHASDVFHAYYRPQHTDLPMPFNAEHIQRFLEETGRDLAKEYAVNHKSGFRSIACWFPQCLHNLVKLPVSPALDNLNSIGMQMQATFTWFLFNYDTWLS